jgi:hypothetical protein
LVGVEVNHNQCPPLHVHNANEKKWFINNKVVEAIMKKIVETSTLILLTHVTQPTLENGGAWVVWN